MQSFTRVTFSCLPAKIIHVWSSHSLKPKLCWTDLVFSPVLEMFHIFIQAFFRAWFNQALHCLVLLVNMTNLLNPTLLTCGNMKQSFLIFIFICCLISFSLDDSMETSNSNSIHLLLTVLGNVSCFAGDWTTRAFYLQVAFYFLTALYTELQPS